MAIANLISPKSADGEHDLGALGLSIELIHSSIRPGLTRATNRTSMALRSTRGTDIYHDSMEQLHQRLSAKGWRLVYVDQQPRLLHPDGLISLTIASGTNVSNPDHRQKPRTHRKGKATRDALAGPRAKVATLFDIPEIEQGEALLAAEAAAPLWILVHERTPRGIKLELSRPVEMTASGIVTDWADRIMIGFLDLDGDLSEFDTPYDDSIDVAVEPL